MLSLQRIKEFLKPGMRILLHAGPAESMALQALLCEAPDCLEGITVCGLFIPGVNRFDYAALTPTTRIETLFVSPAMHASFEAGKLDLLPISYSAYPRFLARHPVDLAILHLPPAQNDIFSCGIGADIAAGMKRFSHRIIVLANPELPVTRGERAAQVEDVAAIFDAPSPLPSFASDGTDDISNRIAHHAVRWIEDGDTLQIGIGKVQAAILRGLSHHRTLRIFSGMIIDEVAALMQAGALAPGASITTGIAVGSAPVHALAAQAEVAFCGIDTTHNALNIAEIDHFVSINSAIEVDLLGQINTETLHGQQISGIGGGGDYMRAARLSRGGRSIIALPSRARGISRIVARLEAGSVSFGRSDIDILVTEHGSVRLRDLSLDARAEAIMAVAAPEHHAELSQAWRTLRATF